MPRIVRASAHALGLPMPTVALVDAKEWIASELESDGWNVSFDQRYPRNGAFADVVAERDRAVHIYTACDMRNFYLIGNGNHEGEIPVAIRHVIENLCGAAEEWPGYAKELYEVYVNCFSEDIAHNRPDMLKRLPQNNGDTYSGKVLVLPFGARHFSLLPQRNGKPSGHRSGVRDSA